MILLLVILIAFIEIAAGLAYYLIHNDRGEREPIGALWIAVGFGFAGGIAAAFIESFVLKVKDLQPGAPLLTMLLASLAVGLIEEAVKFIPLSIFIYPKRFFNEHNDGVIYFALAGLGFGLPENILYSLQFGAGAGLGRIIMTPFFHAATTGMVGYFLAYGKLHKHSRKPAWIALGGAVILHGLYDFGLSSGVAIYSLVSVLITFTMSALLFVLYARATANDQAAGLSVVGCNSFCRTCGYPNPKHLLYCVHCGNHA